MTPRCLNDISQYLFNKPPTQIDGSPTPELLAPTGNY